MKLAELRKQRAAAFDAFKALADKETLSTDEETEYDAGKARVVALDGQITRALEAQELAAASARPVGAQDRPYAAPESDPYISPAAAQARGLNTNTGLVVGGMMRMIGRAAQ